jgi:hypothetical protein
LSEAAVEAPTNNGGAKTIEERQDNALKLLEEHGSLVGRIRTLAIPDPPPGATKFYATHPRERSSFPHGIRTFEALASLALDQSVVIHAERKVSGAVEQIVDEFRLAPGAYRISS